MRIHITLIITCLLLSMNSEAQKDKKEDFKLDNVLIVSQQDKLEDRYSLEVGLITLFNSHEVKTRASLNVIKQGGSPKILLTDSIQRYLKSEGVDTYMLISVRGYDKRFKPSEDIRPLEEELEAGHLFPIYRESASSVTFSIIFYRNGEPVHYELIRTGAVGSRDAVLKKLFRKINRRMKRKWS